MKITSVITIPTKAPTHAHKPEVYSRECALDMIQQMRKREEITIDDVLDLPDRFIVHITVDTAVCNPYFMD